MSGPWHGHAILAFSTALVATCGLAHGQDCVRTSPSTMMRFADLVVAGELDAVRDSVDRDGTEWRILTITPVVVWKGDTHKSVLILCAWDCLSELRIGAAYILYASIKNDLHVTGRCWRNNEWEVALFDRYLLPRPLWTRESEPQTPVEMQDLVALLNHPDYVAAEGAARDFLWLAENRERATQPVLVVLRDPASRRPQLAAIALAEMGAVEAVPDLDAAFSAGEPVLATAALTALSALDTDGRRRDVRIRRGLVSASPTIRYQAVNLYVDEALRDDGAVDVDVAIDVLTQMRERERNPDVVLRIDIRLGDLIAARGQE